MIEMQSLFVLHAKLAVSLPESKCSFMLRGKAKGDGQTWGSRPIPLFTLGF